MKLALAILVAVTAVVLLVKYAPRKEDDEFDDFNDVDKTGYV